MIISMMAGGLGNMMFQMAAGISLASDLGVDHAYTMDGYESVTNHNVSDYPNTIFKGLKQVSLKDYPQLANRVYREPRFAYDPLPKVDNIVLKGYFQSEKYFKHNRKLIESSFEIPKCKFNEAVLKDPCFIHIRRGDYVKLSQTHPTCELSYYRQAIELLQPKSVAVFSDDFDWCGKHLVGRQGVFFYWKDDNIGPVDDLAYMIHCKQAVIANSSFSWWGAWLGEKKEVVAPSQWFGPKGPQDWEDVYCEGWTVI